MTSLRSRHRGFTFVEMALTLFSVGFLLSAVPALLSKGAEVMASSPGSAPAEAAQFSLEGFLEMESRLPCPSADPLSGTEDCNITKGFVPYRTLSLPGPVVNSEGHPFAYSILGGANHLGKATAKYTPEYLEAGASYWLPSVRKTSVQINKLDFCAKLRSQAALGFDSTLLNIHHWRDYVNGSKTNVAWVLVDPGSRNADGSTGTYPLFDASNQPSLSGTSFESPSRVQSGTYDDKVRVGTLTQMFGEQRCPELLASISAAAREADFANENWRVRSFLLDFRTDALRAYQKKQAQAENVQLLAGFDLAMTVSTGVLDVAVAQQSVSGAVAVGISVFNAIAATALSSYGVAQAVIGLAGAKKDVAGATDAVATSQQAVADALTFRSGRYSAFLLLDQRGGRP